MRRFPLDREALREWLRGAYRHPNANGSCADPLVRDGLLRRLAERPAIVFGWRPGSLEDLVPPFDEAGEESELARAYRAFLDRACEVPVNLECMALGLERGPVYTVYFDRASRDRRPRA